MGGAVFDKCGRFFGVKGVSAIFSLRNESKWVKISIIAIIAVYLALCGASFSYHKTEAIRGSFETFDNDDVKYLRSAWTLLETGRYTYKNPEVDTVFIMPGLTTVLAGFVAVFGRFPYLQFRIFQALLGGACLYLIFLCGRRLFATRVGVISAALMALYAPSIYVVSTILTEVCFCFLFLLTFLFTIYAVDTAKMKYYVWGGVFLGLSALFRPSALMFPFAVFAMWLIRKYKLADMLKYGAAVVCVVSAILSPWIIRNAVIFGEFIPLTKSSGNPMFQGTFINYDQSVREYENIDYYKIIGEQSDVDVSKYGHDELADDKIEHMMTKIRFKEVILKEPLKYLIWYTVGKTIRNWYEPFLWVILFDIGIKKLFAQHYIYLLAGIAGFAVFLKRERHKGIMWLPAVSIAYYNAAHLPFYCFSRYMFPTMFCFALFAAYLLDAAVTRKSPLIKITI